MTAMRRALDAVVGRTGAPFAMPVERGKVLEFLDATAPRAVDHRAVTHAPPTYLVTAAFWQEGDIAPWSDPSCPLFDARREGLLIHGSHSFRFPRGPIPIGAELTARQVVLPVTARQGRALGEMLLIDVATEFQAGGELVAVSTTTMIYSEAMGDVKRAADAPAAPPTPPKPTDDELPSFVEGPLTVTDFVRYQGASGDFSAMHHDDAMARAAGYPSVYAVGMRQASVMAGHLADLVGLSAIEELRVEFRQLAWPGDMITYRVRVEGLDATMVAERPDGSAHLKATARLVAGSRAS